MKGMRADFPFRCPGPHAVCLDEFSIFLLVKVRRFGGLHRSVQGGCPVSYFFYSHLPLGTSFLPPTPQLRPRQRLLDLRPSFSPVLP